MRTTAPARRPHAAAALAPPCPTPLARAVAGAWLLAGPLALQAQVLPTGPQVVAGQASIATQGAQMTVRNTPGAILNWQSFSIGAANRVYFDQASAASKVLNRVVGSDPSKIYGSLASNGQVWLLNPNGVLFGQGARVDVAGLVASTLRLNDNDFLAGRFRFTALDGDRAGVRNEGTLTTSFGGQVVLLGRDVHNGGDISAPGGSVSLAATAAVDLVDTGLPNLAVRVQAPAGEVVNLGRLMAAGGLVDVYGAIVNQQGVVQADGYTHDEQGRVVLKATQSLTLAAGSRTSADGAAGGSVTLDAGAGTAMVEGTVSAVGSAGAGGHVDVLGRQVGLTGAAVVDASGETGGGRIRIGGGAEGKDTSVTNARAVYMGPDATVRADALAQGDGGNIVLWADEAMRAYGRFSARGGAAGGSGGFLETSGGWLDAMPAALDLSATAGTAGRWLLDPNDITISNAGQNVNVTPGPVFTSTNDNSVLTTATIAAALNAGTNVTVATASGGQNSQPGDILMVGATLNVNPTAPVSLSLQASRDVLVKDSAITSSGAPLSLNLVSAGAGIGAIEVNNSIINTAGGNVTLRGARATQLQLPDGTFTASTYNAAIGYDTTTDARPSRLFLSTEAALLLDSTLNLGSGNLSVTGYTQVLGGSGLSIGGSTVRAGEIALLGYSTVATRAIGTFISANGGTTDLVATRGLSVQGAGLVGISVEGGARLTLNTPSNPGATALFDGFGSQRGVYIRDASLAATPTPGTPITVIGGQLNITGRTTTGGTAGIEIAPSAASGVPLAPTLDLAAAGSATLSETSATGGNLKLARVRIAGPSAGNFTAQAQTGTVALDRVTYTGSGEFSLAAPRLSVDGSLLQAAATGLNLQFATTGTTPQGLTLSNSVVVTGGGDVRLGSEQQVCSVALGCSVPGLRWLQSSSAGLPALQLTGSSIDAGTGRIEGGGAMAANGFGVLLQDSRLAAREIALAGRSDGANGLTMDRGAISATHALSLDGLSGGNSAAYGVFIGQGSTLQLLDPAPDAASELRITGSAAAATGLFLQGGDAGNGNNETTVTVDSGRLTLRGTSATGRGLYATGTDVLPGGLLFNTLGATRVAIEGRNTNNVNDGLLLFNMNILGPQAGSGNRIDLVGQGRLADGTPGTRFSKTTISSGAPVTVTANGLNFGNTRIAGDEGVALRSDVAATDAPISVFNTTLRTSADGAQIRIEASDGSEVKGRGVYANGQGINFTDTLLRSSGAGGGIVLNGQGALDGAGGYGTVLAGAALQADVVSLRGLGKVDGDGTFLRASASTGARTTIDARDLTVTGFAANATTLRYLGVEVAEQTAITLRDRGTAQFVGDTVSLQGSSATQRVLLGGNAQSVLVSSTGSQQLRFADIDFTPGAGTNVTLLSDSDANLTGRVRIDNANILTGGGNLTVTGGTGKAAGIYSFAPDGSNVPTNTSVREGASGVLINGSVTLDAGTGNVLLQGQAATEGRSPASNFGGNTGVLVTGTAVIAGANVRIDGDGGDKGLGVQVDAPSASRMDINASGALTVTGRGTGNEPNSGSPLPGVAMAGPGQWQAGGALTVTSLGQGLVFGPGAGLTGATVALAGPGRLRLEGSRVEGTSGVSMLAGGANASPADAGGIYVTGGASVTTRDAGALLRLAGASGGAAVGDAGLQAGAGVVVDSAALQAFGGRIELSGQGAASGGVGVALRGASLAADAIAVQGRGTVNADGVRMERSADAVDTNIGARDLTLAGTAAYASDLRTTTGVALLDGTVVALRDRGAVRIDADYVRIEGTNGGRVVIGGDAASMNVSSAASMLLRQADLQFADGAGTSLRLLADSDASGAGRVQIDRSTIATGNASFTVTGGGGAAAGVLTTANSGNTAAGEGAVGLLLVGSTIDAGRGDVSLSASGLNDLSATAPGGYAGLLAGGANRVTGGAITINSRGGATGGRGIDVGNAVAGATLDLTAGRISVDAAGAGLDPLSQQLLPAVQLRSASTWAATAGDLSVTSTLGGLQFDGATLRGSGNVTLRAAEQLALTNTTVRAGAALQMEGHARGNGRNAVLLGGADDLQGASVDLLAQSDGETPIRGLAGGGRIAATEGVLHLTGRNSARNTEGLWLEGPWALSATQRIFIESDNGLRLWRAGPLSASPTLNSPAGVEIALRSDLGTDIGGGDAAIVATDLQRALANQGSGTTTTLRAESPGLRVDAPLALNSRLVLQADTLELTALARLASTASGDALVLGGARNPTIAGFDNQAGANVLSAPNGRWVLRLTDPRTSTLGGLAGAFTAYNLAAQPWSVDGNGNYVTPASGNALGFAISTSQLNPSTAALGGVLSKTYDAATAIALDPATWTLAGLLPGDTLTLSGSTVAQLQDKNVGTAKPVTLDAASVFTVTDAAGRPVFGYDRPAFTANVAPATLVLSGTTVAGKVYDATTTATLASTGRVTPLGNDQVAVGGNVVASFADKNVGTAKPVTVTGLALTGPDAGNYTLVVPAASYSADITPATLALTGLGAANKVYDAGTAATLTGAAAIAPLGADQVLLQGTGSGSYADRNVGNGKPVSVSGYTLAGADAGNYTLQLPTGLRAAITPATLAVTGLTALDKVYDGTTTAVLAGTAAFTPLGDDVLALNGTARGAFGDRNAASAKPVSVSGLALAGPDAGNYTLALPTGLRAAITPAPLTLQGLAAADKTYDGTLAASLSARLGGVVAGDNVGLSVTGAYTDRNAGSARIVNYQASTSGADAANYTLLAGSGFTTASILPATLVYTAVPVNAVQGSALPLLTGSVLGFVAGDTQASATTGTLAWTTDALSTSPAGNYAINGSGLSAANYRFTQAAGNAAALSLRSQPTSTADPVTTTTTTVISTAVFSVMLPVTMSSPTQGRVLDVVQAFAFSGESLAPVTSVTTAGSPAASGNSAPAAGGTARPAASAAGEGVAVAAASGSGAGGSGSGTNSGTGTAAAGNGGASGGTAAASGGGGAAPAASGGTPSATAAGGNAPAGNAPAGSATGPASSTGSGATATAAGSGGAAAPSSTSAAAGGSAPATATADAGAASASGGSASGGNTSGGGTASGGASTGTAAGSGTASATSAAGSGDPASAVASPAPGSSSAVAAAATAGVVVIPGFGTAAGGAEGFGGGDGLTFRSVNFSLLRRDEIQALLAARASYKRKVFSGSIGKLTVDPTLADVPACTSEAQAAAGTCIVTEALKREIEAVAARSARPAAGRSAKRKVKVAAVPNIERKLALLIGVNKYADKRVPELLSAVPDAQAVQTLLESRMGYETTVLENPTRETIIRAFNKLALEADGNDSVVVYYAGHGVVVPVNGVDTGYWLPGDTNAEEPNTWLSNADIAKMVAAIGSRQMMLISDSCYSGSLAGNERVTVDGKAAAADLLSRKAVVVMSSGGDEPVADEGRDGHSVFAWHLMDKLQTLDAWQVGGSIFERVRSAVSKEFPQTPQYGAARSAGHQGNTDYLFERRELEKPAP